jgi:alpha/beta superfamily hydrolase
MNNKIVHLMYNIFIENGFSVIKINFRGVGKSDGVFDNGQGELSDAAAALDWIERQNLDYSQCWVSGFSFGSLICMQLIMRRPEVNNFITISPQPNVYDFSFLAPCPTSGQVIYGENDELVTRESITELDERIKTQKGVDVIFSKIINSNHFFKDKEKELAIEIEKYLKEKTALI